MESESKLGSIKGYDPERGFIFAKTKEVAPDSEKGKKLLADVKNAVPEMSGGKKKARPF